MITGFTKFTVVFEYDFIKERVSRDVLIIPPNFEIGGEVFRERTPALKNALQAELKQMVINMIGITPDRKAMELTESAGRRFAETEEIKAYNKMGIHEIERLRGNEPFHECGMPKYLYGFKVKIVS